MIMIFPIATINTGVILDEVEEAARKARKLPRDIS